MISIESFIQDLKGTDFERYIPLCELLVTLRGEIDRLDDPYISLAYLFLVDTVGAAGDHYRASMRELRRNGN